MIENYKIEISYDGTDYHGWQRQPRKKTIQGRLEKALAKIAKKDISVLGAGRTDAGVHALAQIAGFKADLTLTEEELKRAMNSLLPHDIRIISVQKVDKDFHARRMALSKIYQYRILNTKTISPFLIRYALHWPYPLDLEGMKSACTKFIREADFTPFSSNRLLHPVRKVCRSEIQKKGEEIIYTVEANGFLRYMVRTMVGSLLEIGRGRVSPDVIDDLFKGGKRTLDSPTAEPQGLCLVKVCY
ncbi:MAG: tRNA pseudouridine(38-40) synthase TruA [Candidatus Aminicenantes bacterium]|nr:MAG: tRNA pseudouridine(38-40) synthase TruA [Candidatus Aminicenantes bacterium]